MNGVRTKKTGTYVEKLFVFLGLVFLIYQLLPLFGTGFISDDAYNSQISGTVLVTGRSIATYTWGELVSWVMRNGRPFPIAVYSYPLFYFLKSLTLYKLISCGVVGANVLAFAYWCKLLTKSTSVGLLALWLLPLFFQLREWHDPLLGFHFLIPLVSLFFIISLIFYQRYLAVPRRSALLASAGLYLCSLLTYEVVHLHSVVFVALALIEEEQISIQSLKRAFFKARIHLTSSALIVLLGIVLKSPLNSMFDGGYVIKVANFDLLQSVKAVLIQAYATLPTSYFLKVRAPLSGSITAVDTILVMVFALCLFWLMSTLKPRAKQSLIGLVGLLILLPALLTAASSHQKELLQVGWGYGYIPVFLQYLGGGLAIIALILWLSRRSYQWIRVLGILLITVFCSGSLLITQVQNRAVATNTNKFYKYPRLVLEAALDSGLLADVPSGSTIVMQGRFPHDHEWNVSSHAGKKLSVLPLNEFEARLTKTTALAPQSEKATMPTSTHGIETRPFLDQNHYLLAYKFDPEKGKQGVVYFGKLETARISTELGGVLSLETKQIRRFLYPDGTFGRFPENADANLNFKPIYDWVTSGGSPREELTTANLLEPAFVLNWDQGFLGFEGTPDRNTRWSTGSGLLRILNTTAHPQQIILRMLISTPSPKPMNLVLSSPAGIEHFVLSPTPVDYQRTVLVPPGVYSMSFKSDGSAIDSPDPRKIVFGVHDFRSTPNLATLTPLGATSNLSPTALGVTWLKGFSTLFDGMRVVGHECGAFGEIAIYNPKSSPVNVRAKMEIESAGNAPRQLTLTVGSETTRVTAQGKRTAVSKDFVAQPGITFLKFQNDVRLATEGESTREVVFRVFDFKLELGSNQGDLSQQHSESANHLSAN